LIRKKGKAGKGNVHLIILYRGNLSGRGKRGIVAKGRKRGISGKRKGCFGEGKEAFRGGKSRRELRSGER
jgi:hypothetical protein